MSKVQIPMGFRARSGFGRRSLLRLGILAPAAAACTARGSGQAAAEAGDRCELLDHTHAAWTALLGRFVRDGFVDYAAMKSQARAELEAYLGTLSGVCADHYATWSQSKKIAFWMNAYNAFMVKLVLDNHPLKSVRSIGLLPMAAFRKDFIPMKVLGQGKGKTISLNHIEHEILRKAFREPRIHFAIVCASKSCPILRAEAFRADALEAQLEDAGRSFLGDERRNRYHADSNTLYLSAIFDWFKEDFVKAKGSVLAFATAYLPDAVANKVRSAKPKIEFLEYDWSLNGR